MIKTAQLNNLFAEWEAARPDYNGIFVKDGIINESEWENASTKVLFIAKEANHDYASKAGDFRFDWCNDDSNYPFCYRIAEWAYGITNDFPPFEHFHKAGNHREYYDVLKKVSFMNVKKTGGGGLAEWSVINRAITQDKEFLIRQIEIINPDIIVSSITHIDFVSTLFDVREQDWVSSGYVRCIFRWRNAKVIDFYHPSSRTAPAASYSLLQNIVRSPAFQNL